MPTYKRKKPVTIEAERFQPSQLAWPHGVQKVLWSPTGYAVGSQHDGYVVYPGDMIVTESGGSRYPKRPNEFDREFELIEGTTK